MFLIFIFTIIFSHVYATSLKIATRNSVYDLNPINCDISSFHILSNVYDTLLRVSSSGHLVNGAAKLLVVEGKKIIFEIDSKYFDGTDVLAQDFLDRLREILSVAEFSHRYFVIENAERYALGLVSFDEVGIKAEGNKLIITLSNECEDPISAYGSIFAFPACVPKKYNGPYYPKTILNNKIHLVKNIYYPNFLNVDEVEFIIVKNIFTAINMFFVGDLDIVLRLSNLYSNSLELKEYDNNYKSDFIFVNTKNVDIGERHIISQNIDRAELCRLIFGAVPAYSYIPLSFWRLKEYKLLEESKMPKTAFKRKIRLLCSTSEQNLKIAQYLKEKLSSAGIELEIESLPFFIKQERIASKDYDLVLSGWNVDHDQIPFDFFTMFSANAKDNVMNWDNKEFDACLEEAHKVYETVKKQAYLMEAEKIICEELPIIPIYFSKSYYIINNKIKKISISSGASSIDLRSVILK
jgi:oligopeptide transport system substrate-binding protein